MSPYESPSTIIADFRISDPSEIDIEAIALSRLSIQLTNTATTIRLLRYGSFPGCLFFSESGKRKWLIRGDDVPDVLWPREFPSGATHAADLIGNRTLDNAPGAVQADGWIDSPRSRWYEVDEHSFQFGLHFKPG